MVDLSGFFAGRNENSRRAGTAKVLGFVVFSLLCSSAQAELILTSPPREGKVAGAQQYEPLAKYLSEQTGETVRYVQPRSWLHYQRDMRADKYDIIFDGPHFISWRMKKHHHTPVAKLPGSLSFVVVTSKENSDIKVLTDLVNTKVCGIAPPNLSTITILADLPNPVHQPRLKTPKGGAPGVYRAFKEGKCVAAIFRDAFYYKRFSEEDRASTKVVYKSAPIANQGFSVSDRVSAESRQKIIDALTVSNDAVKPTLKRFAPKAKQFQPIAENDYEEYYKLLTGIIFGWEVGDDNILSRVDGNL